MSLESAVDDGNVTKLKRLLQNDDNVKDLKKIRIINGSTLLHEAVRTGNLECAEVLISYGAPVNTGDKYGNTPLHFAADRGFLDIATLLVSKGANLNRVAVNSTPLDRVNEKGHGQLGQFFISKGAKTRSQIDEEIYKKEKEKNKSGKEQNETQTDSECFIATAACGDRYALEVLTLKEFREVVLRNSWLGRIFILVYNSTSPSIARLICKSKFLRKVVRNAIVSPSVNLAKKIMK